jgi:hypothetical protein
VAPLPLGLRLRCSTRSFHNTVLNGWIAGSRSPLAAVRNDSRPTSIPVAGLSEKSATAISSNGQANNIPFVAFAFDRNGLDFAFGFPVQVNSHQADVLKLSILISLSQAAGLAPESWTNLPTP